MNASISANPPPSKAPDASGLRIAGLTPYSSIDYPGCLSAVVWIQGCPWRCSYCHNPHLQSRTAPPQLHWDEVLAFLKKRVGLLDAVVFSGGEATTDRHLGAAMAEAKALGYKIGLHTAGCYPERLAEVLPLLDWVGLDVKVLWNDYPALTKVPGSGAAARQSLEQVLRSDVHYQIRTTVHPAWLPEPRLRQLGQMLAGEGVMSVSLQHFRATGCTDQTLCAAPAGTYPSAAVLNEMNALFPPGCLSVG